MKLMIRGGFQSVLRVFLSINSFFFSLLLSKGSVEINRDSLRFFKISVGN